MVWPARGEVRHCCATLVARRVSAAAAHTTTQRPPARARACHAHDRRLRECRNESSDSNSNNNNVAVTQTHVMWVDNVVGYMVVGKAKFYHVRWTMRTTGAVSLHSLEDLAASTKLPDTSFFTIFTPALTLFHLNLIAYTSEQ